MSYQDRREKALIIWEEAVRLLPTDVQVQCALWNVQSEMREIAEEMTEYLRAARNYPSKPKHDVFFDK